MAGETTFKEFSEHGARMMEIIKFKQVFTQQAGLTPESLRDLALAKTHLEDALTRYNSACYRIAGTWKRADPDAQ